CGCGVCPNKTNTLARRWNGHAKWEATSTYEREYQKVHAPGRRTTWTFIAIYLIIALVIVCAHFLVRS
ncbi:MAG: hypothetical protein OEZ41_10485, partial [Nitrospirota bacterium]|nr:hypothetical protein [Nitrospirota bacterium]